MLVEMRTANTPKRAPIERGEFVDIARILLLTLEFRSTNVFLFRDNGGRSGMFLAHSEIVKKGNDFF